MSMVRKTALSALGCAALLASTGGVAQEQDQASAGGLLEEITVTAQRREEKIQDVPIAISAFSESQLAALNVTETLGLVKLIPNLLGFNNTGLGTANGYYLRGIGNTESIASFDPPVGTYADDVFISRQNANNLGLFDVERIEVLRGPQGTLFGRNTTGGAINVLLKKPAEEFGGFMEVGFGQFNQFSVRGTVDIPFSDRLQTKFSAYSVKDDGYVSNPVTGENNLNASESLGLRAAMRLSLTDTLTWNLAAQYTNDEGSNILNFAANGPQTASDSPVAIASVAQRCTGIVTRSRFSCTGLVSSGTPLANLVVGNKRNNNLGNEVKNIFLSSNLEWDVGFGTVNFITGSVDLEQKFALDFFNGTNVTGGAPTNPAGGFTITNDGKHRQFSQEIKLTGELNDRARYVAGVYYFREDNTTDFADLFSLSPTLTLVLEDRILENSATAWAAYTQWDFTLADKWTLTAGGRYTDETKKVNFIANINPRLANPIAATRVTSANLVANGIPLEQQTRLFTPRLAVKYDVSDDVNLFASATRGFKSGGWNARGTAPAANIPFAPEKVWSYELGLRSEWFDRKLRLNLTAFKLDIEDLQTPSAFTAPSGAISFVTQNFAGLDNKGIEAELIWQPVEDLTLFTFVGTQDAKYKDIDAVILAQQVNCRTNGLQCNQGIVNPMGDIAEPVRAPDTLTVGGSYRFRLGESLTLTPNVSWAKTGDNNVGTNGGPVDLVDGYDTVDAGLTLANEDAGWQIQANCRNCSDELQIVSTLSALPYVQDPRTWSLAFKYNFGER
jgi:iron complex outermembrane receptor protein